LIHDDANMLFFPLLPEVIGGAMQPGNVVNPIRRVVPQTRVITGRLEYVDERAKRVVVRRKNGKEINLPYAELIFALFPVPNLTGIPGMMAHASPIDSVGDALHIRKCVLDRIEEAEFTEVVAERDRLLTFAVVGSGQRACATAVELCQMLRTVEVSYPVLREHGWQVYLYEDTKIPFTDLEAQIQPQRDRGLEKAGVKLCRNDEVVGLTNRDLAMASGERRPVGLVVNASFKLPAVGMTNQSLHWPFAIEDDLSLKAHQNIWVTAMKKQGQQRRFITTADLVALGNAAGYNAWASSQGYQPRPFRLRKRLLEPYNMGRHSLCRLGGFTFGGAPAWIVSRLTNLLALPGLERNLRILMDWVLDIPFRNDIAVLAPDPTERLQRAHFEPGDEIIRQGDEGETAYVIESGRLEVLKDGSKLGELGEGDCFGEIALLSKVRRTATVRCLTACELAVLARDDFGVLATGFGSLAEAIRKQAEERVQSLRDDG
jgi:NADH dehydrogenase FAD-containing subunit